MEALVTGEAEFRRVLSGSVPADFYVEGHCRPSKRTRVDAPLVHSDAEIYHQQEKISPTGSLPDECLFEILRRVDGAERSICASVCKRWLALLSSIRKHEIRHSAPPPQAAVDASMVPEEAEKENDGHLTRCLEGRRATDVRLAAIAVCTPSRGGLGKLLIRGSNPTRGVTDFGLSAIARGCPSLRVLHLWDVHSVLDRGLCEIATGCHNLDNLDLLRCSSITDKGLIAIADNCPSLTSLSIDSCANVGNGSLQAFARCCPRLESISIKDCPLVGDQGVASLLSSGSSALAKVRLTGLCITDFSLAVIGHYGKSITHLSLSNLKNVTEKGFWIMGCAQSLQVLVSLSIIQCLGMTDRTLEAIAKGCPMLRHIRIHGCASASDRGLVLFCKWAGCLESLHIGECNSITQLGLTCALSVSGEKLKSLSVVRCVGVRDMSQVDLMFRPCRSLRSLSITYSPGFGSVNLATMARMCPEIRCLDLSGLYGITDDGLLALLQCCKSGLVKVNLTGCMNLSDGIVTLIARLHGGTINVLNLTGCWKITDTSLLAIADNCPLLNNLDISGCAVTDAGVAALSCAERMNLKFLGLSGCPRLSNKCVPFILKLGKNLRGLTLQLCNSISRKKVSSMKEKLWRCDILA